MVSQVPKTTLITGSTGFIGSHLTRHLVEKGWDVHVVVRPTSNMRPLTDVMKRISIHVHDGTTAQLMGIMKNSKPIILFHLAAHFLAEHSYNDIEPLIQSNVLFGNQLIESMVNRDVFHLINTGTSWQHFENKNYSPANLYAATKQAGNRRCCQTN